MKKLLLIFVIILYFPSVFFRFIDGKAQAAAILVSLAAAFLLACMNIVCAVFTAKRLRANPQRRQAVSRTILLMKLALIPFYFINFMLWSMLSGMFLLTPGGIFVDMILVPIGIGFTYTILLATSSYSIALLLSLYKSGDLSRRQLLLYSIFQLIFVADVIDQWFIYKLTKSNEPNINPEFH